MFKACDYCRHRKKRCKTTFQSARCSECDHLDLPCEFSPRVPSLKRRQTSRQVVARLGIGRDTWVEANTHKTSVNDGDCQVHIEGLSGMIDKALLPRTSTSTSTSTSTTPHFQGAPGDLAELYRHDVAPFIPFLPQQLLDMLSADGSILADCVHIACAVSLNKAVVCRPPTVRAVQDDLRQRHVALSDAAGALLLMPYIQFDNELVDKVFACVEAEHARHPVPLPVLAGVLSCHAWRRLIDAPCRPLDLPPGALQEYAESLDTTTFSHHYLQIANLALRFGHQCAAFKLGATPRETQLAWARLEYDCLLWQIRLPSHFLDLRDELPATAESLVLHSLSNLLLLSLYSHILTQPGSLGNMLALRPVPGVLHFMCALARSVFICPRAIIDRWAIVVDIQAIAARVMLRLWHETQFANCRAIVNLWHDVGGRYEYLTRQVRDEIGSGPWTVDGIDGYSVFWTFRDLRTLTLEMICGGGPCA